MTEILTTPIIFIIFNRPATTKQVFERIRAAKPQTLLLIADGPRTSDEAIICRETRKIVEAVDWNCKVLKNYSEDNLDCGRRIVSGLDWAFSIVEEAIILEDDCLPAPSFFSFCQTLLDHYRNDKRIMHISGNNFQFGQCKSKYSYYFSKYSHIWGWATWRRAWRCFDYELQSWPEFKRTGMIKTVCDDHLEQIKWTRAFDQAFTNKHDDNWDVQWMYACWSQSGLSILPNVNLVSNIGFGSDATHTSDITNPVSSLPVGDIWEINHPSLIVRHTESDAYTFDQIFGGKGRRVTYHYLNGLRQRLSALKGYLVKCN